MRRISSTVHTIALTLLIGAAACAKKKKGSDHNDSTNPTVTVISSGGASTGGNGTTADSQADTHTKVVYDFFKGLPAAGDTRRLVVGQQSNNAKYYAAGYTTYVKGLQAATGKWPAILGADYDMGLPQNSTLLDLGGVNQMLIDYWRAGGLVTVMWTARNPWTLSGAGDLTKIGALAELTTAGNAAYDDWHRQLDHVAEGLDQLQQAGVTVLWRPLHEQNGRWFWWGGKPVADYVALWQDMFHYLTVTKGLHNLLWVFAPNLKDAPSVAAEITYFPGDAYVDVVAPDAYADSLVISAYGDLVALGKPFALAEVGPSNSSKDQLAFDYARLLKTVKSNYPSATYILGWSDNWSMLKNLKATELMNDSWVITRDKLPAH